MSSTLIDLIVALVHLGIIRMALFGIANLLRALDPTELMREIFRYAARIVSVIAITKRASRRPIGGSGHIDRRFPDLVLLPRSI